MLDRRLRCRALAEDRRGLAAVEYALICLMMSAMLLTMVPKLQSGLGAAFRTIVTNLTAAIS